MTDLKRIKISANMIALEAATPAHSMEGIVDRLPGFFTDVKEFLSDLFSSSASTSAGLLDVSHTGRKVKGSQYTDIMNTVVYTPPGLKVTYQEYLDVLDKAQNIAESIPKDTLRPFAIWIAVMLANPDRLASLHSERDVLDYQEHDIAGIKKAIAECFEAGNATTEQPFGKLFRKSSDWETVAQQANALNERVNGLKNTTYVDLVKQITMSLDTLLTRIKEEPVEYRTSGNALQVIAKLCTSMATECEFYSVYRFQVLSALTALKDSEANFKDIK
jgi:hypothetical protein